MAVTPEEYFVEARSRFENAAAAAGLVDRWYRIAGRPVRLAFAGPTLLPSVTPALAHLAIDPQPEAALTVHFFDSESTGTPMARPPWPPTSYGRKGEIEGFNTERIRTVYQPGVDLLHMIDRERGEALYWAPSFRLIQWWEISFPMRTILHWWSLGQPLQPVHSGAVGTAGRGVLIAGKSGSGKSTATLACLLYGLQYAGDDYVMVRHAPQPFVYSLYSTAKVEPDNLERLPELRPWLSNPDQLATQKAMVFLNEVVPSQITEGFPLAAILLPRITGLRDTTFEPARPADALFALAPTTVNHLPGASEHAFAKMSTLVRQVPAYWLNAGTDLEQVPATVLRILGSLS